MRNYLLFLLLIIGVPQSFGQLKQKMADGHFELMEYAKCVEMYDELARKCISGSKNGDWNNVRKAAESHYHLFEMEEAIKLYASLHGKNQLKEEDRILYIQCLRYEQQYKKSDEVIRESASLFPANPYFKRMLAGIETFDQLYADSAFYRLQAARINSGEGDFGAAYFKQSIVYASKAMNPGFLTPSYGWDNDFYLNLLQSHFNADSSLQDGQLLRHQFLSKAHDGPVSFNQDATEMVITRNLIGKKKNGQSIVVLALYFSNWENDAWSDLVAFEFNDESANVGHGVFDESGQRLYFVSEVPGGHGGADIYVSERSGKGWGTPTNLGPLVNTERDELFPFVQKNVLYFASNGHFGLGGLDVFEFDLKSSAAAHNLGYPISTSSDDFGLIYDGSGCIGFVSSNREANIDHLYHVKKRPIHLNLRGEVFEQYATLEPSSAQTVWIRNLSTNELDSLVTNELGQFEKTLRIHQDYRIYTQKAEYILLKEAHVSTQGIRQDSTLLCQLILKPTTIQVHLRVIEKESRKIIPDALVTITDYNLNWDTTLVTNTDGRVSLTVNRNIVLWAHGSKKGFIDTEVSFNTQNINDRVIDLELELPLIKKGEKFKLENIFYDLNKSTLRPESMAALDKLADFIIKNNLRIELSAHTDSRGSTVYNQKLSQARAQSCVDYLLKKGVNTKNINAKGYGEAQLVNKCKDGVLCTEDEHQENRRTEVKILEVN